MRIAVDAARGLAYLHERNILHRDFRTGNILLTEVCVVTPRFTSHFVDDWLLGAFYFG